MAYNYNNYFNNCGVNCGDYGDHADNKGYNDHYDHGHDNHYDYGYNNHGNSTSYDRDAGIEDYWVCSDSGCNDHSRSGYDDHRRHGYNNHKNEPTGNHKNHFNDSPAATTMSYSIDGIDAHSTDDWVKLGDAIDDLKKLRNAIADLPNKKLDAEGKDFTLELESGANTDDKFLPGEKPKYGQFNETRNNIKKLWQKIWGNEGNDWPAEMKKGDRMKKSDYQKLFNKFESLARLDQSKFYDNHYDSKKSGKHDGEKD